MIKDSIQERLLHISNELRFQERYEDSDLINKLMLLTTALEIHTDLGLEVGIYARRSGVRL